jgi:putative Mg2+ transporter-C (MgtC) family protein
VVEWEILTRLAVAAGLTAIIGLDRELRAKAAGLRTNIVVGTATAAFAYIGAEVIAGGQADPTRIASQVVSGIGFLGGGAIFAAGGKPSGLTTAAALWGSAAVGMSAGIGSYGLAVALVFVLFVVLWPLDMLTVRLIAARGRQLMHLKVVLDDLRVFTDVKRAVSDDRVRIDDFDLVEVQGRPTVDLRVSGRGVVMSALLDHLEELPGVVLVAHQSVPGLAD